MPRLSESEFTALLDGENSIEGIVYVATTNEFEALGEKIRCRPSRFDLVLEVKNPGAEERAAYLRSRNVGDHPLMEDMVEASEGFSFAHLKELIIAVCCFGRELKEEVERLRGMLPEVKKVTVSDGYD